MEKFLGVASKRGFFFVFWDLLAPNGAAAGFFPDPGLALGGWEGVIETKVSICFGKQLPAFGALVLCVDSHIAPALLPILASDRIGDKGLRFLWIRYLFEPL